jgi:predicted permease
MTFWSLAQIIGGFVAIVAVGWALRRFGVLRREDARPINNLIIYVGLPAMIFQAVHPADLDLGLGLIAAIAWAVFIIVALLAWFSARSLKLGRTVAGGFIIAAALGNTGYIGYPVAQAFLGEQGLVREIFYDVFGTVAAFLFVGLLIAEKMGAAEGEAKVNPVIEALKFPAVLALFAALLLRPVTIPPLVGDGLDVLASMVVPLIMISVGLSLRPSTLHSYAVPLGLLAGLRLIVAPLIALGLGMLAFPEQDIVRLLVLASGMPAMMLTLVIGERFGLDTDFIAGAILVTTVASAVTLPLMQVLVA